MHELIGDITLCILFAWVLGLLAHFSRQPLILAYLIAGFFIGPFGMGWVKSQESISIISELGLIFMLFMIGLEIDLKKIVRAGKVILFAAGGQLLGGCLLGILFFVGIGLSLGGGGKFDALYLCVACALSSTVIIVKVLYEKRELDTLPGRITLGVLVLQDIFAILFLAVQPSLDNLQVSVILLSIARVGALVATALVLSRYVLPRLFHQIARRPELILLGALAWCFLIGEIAEKLHLSREMGSLVAGVSLSTFPYALDVTAKVTTLRDFFITLFFVALGMTIPDSRPVGDRARADHRRLHGGQPRGDDVYAALSDEAGPARQPVAGDQPGADLRIFAGGDPDRRRRQPYHDRNRERGILRLRGAGGPEHLRHDAQRPDYALADRPPETDRDPRSRPCPCRRSRAREGGHGETRRIVILGFFRAASALLAEIERQNQSLLEQISVIDFNPLVFRTLTDRGLHVIYGDISNVDTLVHAGIGKAEIIILSVPDSLLVGASNEKLVRHVRTLNPTAKIVATADFLSDVKRSLCGRRRLRHGDPAQRCPRALYGDRGRRCRPAGRQARRDGRAARRTPRGAALSAIL